jgi:hypothetical protein
MSGGATSRRRSSSGGTRTRLPVSGYDEMPLYQIREEAYGLSPAELDVLRSYEEQHEGRDTLLRTFDTLQDGGARGRESGTSSRSGTSRTTSNRGGSATRGASTREGSGRAGSSKRTTDHDLIRGWAEERGGKPVSVRGTGRGGEAGVLRFDFEGYGAGGDELRPISWTEFFKKFDENNLEFIYQDRTRDGRESRFFKFVSANGGRRKR